MVTRLEELKFVHQMSNFPLELVVYITASQTKSRLRISLSLTAPLGDVSERKDALCVAEKLSNLHRRVTNFILSVSLKTQPLLESSHQKLNHRRVTCYCGVH